MKRVIPVLLALSLLMCLSACGGKAAPAPSGRTAEEKAAAVQAAQESKNGGGAVDMTDFAKMVEAGASDEELADALFGGAFSDMDGAELLSACPIELTGEETVAMSNFMHSGRYLIENQVIYGITHLHDGSPVLGRSSFTSNADGIRQQDFEPLDNTGTSLYLNMVGNELYYLRGDLTSGKYNVARISRSGGQPELLTEDGADYLQLSGGRIWYCEGDWYTLWSMDMDGGDARLELDRSVYFPYVIRGEWLLFQDDADNESLHLLYLPTGTEFKLNDEVSYFPVIRGTKLFYFEATGHDSDYYLMCADLSTAEAVWDDELGLYTVEFGSVTRSDNLLDTECYIGDKWFYGTAYKGKPIPAGDWASSPAYKTGSHTVTVYTDDFYRISFYRDGKNIVQEIHLTDSVTGKDIALKHRVN